MGLGFWFHLENYNGIYEFFYTCTVVCPYFFSCSCMCICTCQNINIQVYDCCQHIANCLDRKNVRPSYLLVSKPDIVFSTNWIRKRFIQTMYHVSYGISKLGNEWYLFEI